MSRELLPRYDIYAYSDYTTYEEKYEFGDWVRWEDVDKLVFDEEANQEIQGLRKENQRLKVRLSKIADAMKGYEG